jgi:hypothetical protein
MANRIDEIMNEFPEPEERPPVGPGANRMKWNPAQPDAVPINFNQTSRFQLQRPEPAAPPQFMAQGDLDAILDQIAAENALPPHKKNAAKINALKQQAQEIAKRLESLWVQKSADEMLPRIDEDHSDF